MSVTSIKKQKRNKKYKTYKKNDKKQKRKKKLNWHQPDFIIWDCPKAWGENKWSAAVTRWISQRLSVVVRETVWLLCSASVHFQPLLLFFYKYWFFCLFFCSMTEMLFTSFADNITSGFWFTMLFFISCHCCWRGEGMLHNHLTWRESVKDCLHLSTKPFSKQ